MSVPASAPRVCLFVDLDDSLFNSLRKCAPGAVLQPAALLANGDVISYTSQGQRALLAWLRQGAVVIPVTARSVDAFARVLVDLPGPAVVSFGGVILDAQRRPDLQWAARMAPELAAARPFLDEAFAKVTAWIAAHRTDAWVKLVEELGQTQYLLSKHRSANAQALSEMAEQVLAPLAAAHPGWRVHQNDNNLTLLPPCLDKAHAVAYLMETLRASAGEIVTVGLGDSLSDTGFLSLCDYAMAPRGTQLGRRLLGGDRP
ncbi:MAG: hypothetical protein V4739_01685 [Pseudomonadota bacterium]